MTQAAQRSTAGGRGRRGGKDIIEAAALRAFYDRGYHGTSIRDIAAAAGMTPPSLYHHFTNKQDILSVVMARIMQDVLATTRGALLRSGAAPAAQLRALVGSWVQFHARRQIEAKVGYAELNSLEPDGRRLIVALRDEQEGMFRDVVLHGVEEGVFHTPHPVDAARAIVNMGTAVSSWYDVDGSLTPAQLADIYADLALSVVGYRGIG